MSFSQVGNPVTGFALSGNDLTITLSDGSSFTQDVTSFGVDENNFVSSGALSGSDLILTMDDATTVTVDASGLAIDNNTTVSSGTVSGTDIILTLSDSSVITIDATTLATGTSTQVVSGAVVGTDLVLTMGDASTVTIDATNLVSGSTLSATNDRWYISYGSNANTEVGVSTNDSTINQQLPLYFGQELSQGEEFKWNFMSNGGSNLQIGIWDGAESPVAYNAGSADDSNWGTAFKYAAGFIAGSNTTLTNTTNGSKYVVSNADALAIRFYDSGHLTLGEVSVSPEVELSLRHN